MRIVLDTNVLIAAFIARGTCSELFEHCIHHHQLITSEFLLKEFRQKLVHKFKMSVKDVAKARRLLLSRMVLVEPWELEKPVCRDPNDDPVLGTAMAGNSHCIVTGDKDLLVLKKYKTIDIISPKLFWKYEK